MPRIRSRFAVVRCFLLACLGMLAATVLAEVYLRLVEATPLWQILPAAEASLYGPDPDTGYALRPGASGLWLTENRSRVQVSGQGLRDHETAFAKSPGVFRIALAGDSVTEALQVSLQETFSERLEQDFSRSGRRVEVVNLGLSGAVPTVQVARMGSLGQRFAPDLQVYMINLFDFLSPILADDGTFPGYVLESDGDYHLGRKYRDSGLYRFRTSRSGDLYYWLLDNLRVVRVLNSRKNHGFGLNETQQAQASNPPACDDGRVRKLLAIVRNARDPHGKPEIFGAFVRDVAAVSRAAGAPALLAIRGLSGGCDAERVAKGELREELQGILDEAGISMLDMDAALAGALAHAGAGYTTRDLYGFGSHIGAGHLNPFGHRMFADALFAVLRSRLPAPGHATPSNH